MTQEVAFHDAVVAEVDRTLSSDQFTNAPEGAKSAARDFLSAKSPILFGDETTAALSEGRNLTSSDPKADAMSFRYNDSLVGQEGQVQNLEMILAVAQAAKERMGASSPEIAAHLVGRIDAITQTLDRMRLFIESGAEVPERTPEQQALFLAQRVLRCIRLAHGNGVLMTGFTSGSTYEGGEAGGRSEIHLREGDLAKLEVLDVRNELEKKYGVDRDHSAFPDLEALEAEGSYEDHEQTYLFVQEEGEGNALPTYEVRVRKVTSSQGEETCYLTIKCGDGESRAETNCKIEKDLYEALLGLQQEGYRTIQKRRYLVAKDGIAETTIDKALLADGTYDFSAEVEFNPGITEIPADFVPPAWIKAERKGKGWKMRNIALMDWVKPQE